MTYVRVLREHSTGQRVWSSWHIADGQVLRKARCGRLKGVRTEGQVQRPLYKGPGSGSFVSTRVCQRCEADPSVHWSRRKKP